MSPTPPFDLGASTYRHVLDAPKPQVAVLPLGATEPHNLHLPYGTDTYQVTMLAEEACGAAAAKGAPVWLLPVIPYGTETNLMRFPLTINVNPSTLGRMIGDIVESLETHGIKKLVLLNGHGGNELKWILREWYGKADVHIFICHWFRMISDVRKEILNDLSGDHADELETSTMLYLRPDLVHMEEADAGSMRPPRLQTLKKGWVEYSRPWHVLTTNTGAGDPRQATAEKGRQLARAFVDRFSTFLVELAAADIDADFPMESR